MKISDDTKKKLKNLRTEENGLEKASLEDVLLWLLQDEEGDVGVKDAGAEAVPGPKKKRKILVCDALYTLELISERSGMLEYLTGFELSDVQLLTKRFQEVRIVVLVFCFFAWRGHAPILSLFF